MKLIKAVIALIIFVNVVALAQPSGFETPKAANGTFSFTATCVPALLPESTTVDLGDFWIPTVPTNLGSIPMAFTLYGQVAPASYTVTCTRLDNEAPGVGGPVKLTSEWVLTDHNGSYTYTGLASKSGVELLAPPPGGKPCDAYATIVVYAKSVEILATAAPAEYAFIVRFQATLDNI